MFASSSFLSTNSTKTSCDEVNQIQIPEKVTLTIMYTLSLIYNVLFKSKQYSDFSEALGQVAEFDNLPVVSANTTKSK